ncbi:hypothetical protein CERSUDRAFT_93044 [Gelatoporia subvermispora B]|uniref:F-box domain-containing protein n=1 Tax=Ceriporiopsis subvermispora (strain B) TaxID=914234 RepID=M2PQZ6_CERS8|nr:hypothetical protein CERSUDRAFT_93044 [Gelatoporia subvermispora B]
MHRCWLIPELTRVIVEQLDANHIKTDRPTLAALARTNSVFLEPALDTLWHHLDSLSQLLWLFPRNALKTKVLEQDDVRWLVVDLARPLLPHEWDRLKAYAPRVKSVGAKRWLPINSQSDVAYFSTLEAAAPSARLLSGSIYEAMRAQLPIPILPNLKELQWIIPGDLFESFDDVELFLTPTLQRLYIGIEWPGEAEDLGDILVPTVQTLPHACPQLQEIQIFNPSENVSAYFLQCISQLMSLRNVGIWCTGQHLDDLFDRLRNLPQLQALHLRCTDSFVIPIGHASPFTLRRLALTGMKFNTFVDLLRYMQPRGVASFEIEFDEIPTANQLHNIFLGIRDSWADTIEEIDISTHASSVQDPIGDEHVVTLQALQPLLHLSKLREIYTGTANAWDLDDAAIWVMVDAWPSLRVMDFEAGLSRAREVKTTVRSLITLAHCCRHLETLALAIDACDIPLLVPIRSQPAGLVVYQVRDPPRGQPGAPSNTWGSVSFINNIMTKKVHLGYSVFNNQAALGLLLLKCFPNLEEIETADRREIEDAPMDENDDDDNGDEGEDEEDEEIDDAIDAAGHVTNTVVAGGAGTMQNGPANTGNQPNAVTPWPMFLQEFKRRRPDNWQQVHIG